ncbi:MAG: cellulase family glycosylhydrolase, partial [Thermoguttaceae bacterium]
MKTIQYTHSRRFAATRLAGIVAFACACFVLASSLLADETFVQKHGRLSVKGNKIVDKDGSPTTLHGMSLYCWAPQGTQFFNTSAINHFARDWKCTVIRIAILPRAYKNNPTKEIDKLKTVMDACIANGIYGIIDWHSMRGAQNDVASSQAFFSALATAYGKTPNIMYEPWNEPEQEPWPVIKKYHEAIISKIRPIDPD